jgi:MoaA/NifB/PqqE/SkfB family radical SAM enzyme
MSLLNIVKRWLKNMIEHKCTILESSTKKILSSPNYNYIFDKQTGYFMRWGNTKKTDPQWSEYGPEIADIEISTSCDKGCAFCYKGNTRNGHSMGIEKFKQVMRELPRTLTQIAFGIGDIDLCDDLEAIFAYTRSKGIIPNVTINAHKMTSEQYDMLAKYCGAVAVSLYDYDECYSAVKQLSDRGMKQVNIHCLLSGETYSRCLQVINDATIDNRLVGHLNAIVFLHLKKRGRATSDSFSKIPDEQLQRVIESALKHNVGFGFDSCSAHRVMKYLPEEYHNKVEPCESSLFSMYINVSGVAYPCSFTEVETYKGIDMTTIKTFTDVWNGEGYKKFRKECLGNCRKCPVYDID